MVLILIIIAEEVTVPMLVLAAAGPVVQAVLAAGFVLAAVVVTAVVSDEIIAVSASVEIYLLHSLVSQSPFLSRYLEDLYSFNHSVDKIVKSNYSYRFRFTNPSL